MRRLTALAVLLTLLALGGCEFAIPLQQYEGPERPLSEISVIKSYIGNPFADEYHATLMSFITTDAGGQRRHKSLGMLGFTDHPKEIRVLPGEVTVELYCFNSPVYAYHPIITLPLQAGHTYLLKCHKVDGKATASLVEEVKTVGAGAVGR
jgi:hypothetical protein